MAILKKTLFPENLEKYSVLVQDTEPTSRYFKITELPDTFTGGKNAFLIQGSEYLVADTIVKIEIKDSQGNVIYHEPGEGVPEYYEGTSKVIAVYIYPDTSFGPCTITILGELSEYVDANGITQQIPLQYRDTYNVRWQGVVNVNPFQQNTTKIRFYRRPKIDITEQVLPVFNRTVVSKTLTGNISGVPVQPLSGSDFRTYKGILLYELQMGGSDIFSQSMENTTMSINVDGKIYAPTITDVFTDKKAYVNIPYFTTASLLPTYQSVSGFTNKPFTITYEDSETLSNSNVSSSFAVINITDLESFTGDPARIKVYASSRQDLGDYQLLEDIQLESSEILLEREFQNQLNVRTGIFTQTILDNFWVTESLDTTPTISVDNSVLMKSVRLEPQNDFSSSNGLFTFHYKNELQFNKNTEYQLDFTPLIASSAGFAGLEVYLSGSAFANTENNRFGKEVFLLNRNQTYGSFDKQQVIFKPDMDGTGQVVFVINGGVWHLSNISLRAAHESFFSPNETTLIADVPTKINNETFDFKFEIYDINNNYVPVTIEKTFTFTGGNDVRIRRDLEVIPTVNQFNFSTSSAFPSSIIIDYVKTGLTGSVTFLSQAVDTTGLGITTADLTMGSNYPGLLNIVDVDTVELPIEAFTASLSGGKKVGAITYTASCENINRYFTIYRVEQGAPSYLFYATADKNNFTFDPDDNYKSVVQDDFIDIRLVKQNLPSIAPLGLIISSASLDGPGNTTAPLTEIGTIGNATIYRLFVTSSTHTTDGYYFGLGQSTYDFDLLTVDGHFTSSITIDAIEKGDKGKGLIATSDANQFFYKMTDLAPTPTSQTITILVKRQNLGSLTNPITVTSTVGAPTLSSPTNEGNGVTSYTISAGQTSNYRYISGTHTYTFTAYDLNGNPYSDEVTISTVISESQISVNLTNENATLPALSTGFVASGSFTLTSGSVSVKVGGEDISREENLTTNNRFDIISATGTGCTPNDTTPDDATYGITSLSADSGSLSLLVRYKDGRGTSTDITKVVSYSKAKAAAPLLSISTTNKAQSVSAKSTGAQEDSFANSVVTVAQTYNGSTSNLSLTSLNASSSDLASIVTNNSTGVITLSGRTLANGTNAASLAVTASVVDAEGQSRTLTDTISLTKVKKAVPSVRISATPQSQTVAANAAGTQTGTLTNVTITALEGTTDRFTSMVIASSSGFSTAPTVSGNTLTMTSAVMNANEASVTLTVTHTDSEGTTGQTQTITIRASKIKQGESGVVVNLNPPSQIVTRSNTGTYGTPSSFVVSVTEGATTYTYDDSSPFGVSTFRITNLSGGTNSNGTITPTTPTTTAGTTVTFNVVYVNAAGTEATISQTHRVSVTLDGQTGPGVVFTGVWEAGRAYQFSTGAGTGRRDVVLWSTNGSAPYEVYYAAIRPHTSATGNVADGAPNQTSQTGWESLGTQDFFVAAKIGLFEDSYVQSTLNIGTNNNGGVSSANITLAGGSTNPYLSIGQSGTVGSQGYNVNGIFLGLDSGTAKFSIRNGDVSFIRWTGTSLEIKGSLNFTNQSSVDLTGFGGYTALSGSVNTAQLTANTGVSNAATAQSTANNAATAASNAQSTANNAATAASNAQSTATNAINTLQAVVDGNSTLTGTFINDQFIYSPNIAGQNGYFSDIFRVGSNGITLDGTNKSIYVGSGFYNNANTPFYFKSGSSDVFSLGNKLSFNGNALTVSGIINATAGNFSGNITSTATISGGTISGGIITGGSINIGNGTFVVDGGGVLTATGANINGTITSNQGTIGGWNINEDGLSFSANNNARGVRLNSLRGALEITTSGSVTVDINSNEFLTNLSIATNVWTDTAMSITTTNIPGDGTYVYGPASTVSFNLLAGQTYQFSMGTGFLPTVSGTSNIYNAIGYGVIISQNSTPTEANAEYFLSDGKYRSSAGQMQITPLSAVFTANTSGTYYIRPFINGISFNIIQRPGGEEDVQYIPLVLNNPLYYYGNEIIRSTQKTEVVGGGIQVVKDTDTYFKVDRNASGGVGSPFVFTTGASVAFEGSAVGDANDFSVRDFESVSIGGTGGYISFSPSSVTSFYDTTPVGSGGIRMNSNNFIRLEPNGPGGYFAYVGYSNNANLQIKVANGTNPSDERVKTEIEILEDGSIEKINEIVLKKFKYKDCETGGPTGHKKIGVIAQDMQKTSLTELVVDNSNGHQLEVDYDSLLGHALKAIQELSAKVEKLESIISGSI